MSSDPKLVVVKIGGGLTAVAGALQRVCSTVAGSARHRPILVVPGGGPFADAVRNFDRQVGLSPDAAHWMALLAMDQYAHVLAGLLPGSIMVEEPGTIQAQLGVGRPLVLAPSRWMRAADVLPHSWEATSDSIAAFVAGALGADRLVLVKPTTDPDQPLDPCFPVVVPAGLPFYLVGCECLAELEARLTS